MNRFRAIRLTLLSTILIIAAACLAIVKYEGPLPLRLELHRLMLLNSLSGINGGMMTPDGTITIYSLGTRVNGSLPLTDDDPMVLASLSKPITAMITRHLIAQNRLSLEDRLVDLLPHYAYHADPRFAQITIRHLLQHRAGFNRQRSGDPIMDHAGNFSCQHAIQKGLSSPLDYTPDAEYSYSNIGYCLLGEILERSTGDSYAALLHQFLQFSNREALYPAIHLTTHPLDQLEEPILTPPLTFQDLHNILPVGGIISDVTTLLKLYQLELSQRSKITPPPSSKEFSYYGLGWRIWPQPEEQPPILTHFGSLPHKTAFAAILPNDVIILFFIEGNLPDYNEQFIALAHRLYRYYGRTQ